MARKHKKGLDYFPHDVNPSKDRGLEYIEAQFGINGYAIYFKLLEKIYENGYFIKWLHRDTLIFSGRINVDINSVDDIMNSLVSEGLFSENLFKRYHILTSKGIQERYIEATIRRKGIEMVENYLLVDTKLINVNINLINVDINSINVDISTQSKVQYSTVNESIRVRARTHARGGEVESHTNQDNNCENLAPFECGNEPLSDDYPEQIIITNENTNQYMNVWKKCKFSNVRVTQSDLRIGFIHFIETYPDKYEQTFDGFLKAVEKVVTYINNNNDLQGKGDFGGRMKMTAAKFLQCKNGIWWMDKIADGLYNMPPKKKEIDTRV